MSKDAPEWLVEVCERMRWDVSEWRRINWREMLPSVDERALEALSGYENAGDIWKRRVPWWMTSFDEGVNVTVICAHTDGQPMLCVCEFVSLTRSYPLDRTLLKESYDVTGVVSVADAVQSFGMLAKAHDIDEDNDCDNDCDNTCGTLPRKEQHA